jgi:glutathione S-transferase
MEQVVVHGVPGSPYVRIALLGLEEKRAAYRLAAMGPGQGRSPEHLARHPFGRIPVMEHDGFMLYESQAILRYVDQVFPGPSLTPTDPRAAARMNQVIGIVDWYLFPTAGRGIAFNRVVAPKFGLPVNEAAVTEAIPAARTAITALDGILGAQSFVAGESLSLADLMLAPHLDMLADAPEGAALLNGTQLAAWLARMRQRPSMQATTWERLAGAAQHGR